MTSMLYITEPIQPFRAISMYKAINLLNLPTPARPVTAIAVEPATPRPRVWWRRWMQEAPRLPASPCRPLWRRRPRDWRAVPAYMWMSYVCNQCNWLWPPMIRFRLVHRAWRPLIELTRRRHVKFRKRPAK